MCAFANFSLNKAAAQNGAYRNLDSPLAHDPIKKIEIKNAGEWEKQIQFYRTHLDVFIEEVFGVKLFDFQKVIARAISKTNNSVIIECRSLGKTWELALILLALGTLYSDCPIGVVSGNRKQANNVVKKIEHDFAKNPNIAREIVFPIKLSTDEGIVNLRSGSYIETFVLGHSGDSGRGGRYKVVLIDEARLVKELAINEVILPTLQYSRPVYYKYKDSGYVDFDSKIIQTSSAYLKACDLYNRFEIHINEMRNDNDHYFACALNYDPGIRNGIIKESYIEDQKRNIPSSVFNYEWNSVFVGSQENSYFPYDLTEPCRKLQRVEVVQPRDSKSIYVMGVDPAVSGNPNTDNAIITVLKLKEKPDGTYIKDLVYMRSLHGYQLDQLADEIRKTYTRFPNTQKIVVDVMNVGQGLIPLLDMVWVDPVTNKEYPPFVPDDDPKRMMMPDAVPLVRAVLPGVESNNRMATYTRLCLERETLNLPVSSSRIDFIRSNNDDDDNDTHLTKSKAQMLVEEKAIFIEADALQHEMANIIPALTSNGRIIYDRATKSIRRDRYTCMAMTLDYVRELEEINKDEIRSDGETVVGIALHF